MMVWVLYMMLTTASGEIQMWEQGSFAEEAECKEYVEQLSRELPAYEFMCVEEEFVPRFNEVRVEIYSD